jgi:lipopolysaccharide transport system ATP-binding protein
MSSDIALKIENLSKCYQIYEKPRDRLKQFVLPRLRHLFDLPPTQYYREFWALKNISFEVKKGETVGIIGCNGSGKSTLLQIICGILTPTNGSITTEGRIAALLELGSGFNPEFTGRENVYMNASVLGLSKNEIDSRFEEIANFADIGEFIEQPVKTYSSGMMVRLAFAVQTQVEPNILIVDEALAVGDAKFQARCFERLKQLKEGGTSILLVTHSTEQIVMHCSRAVLLNRGIVIDSGEPKKVVNRYLDLLFGKERKQINEPNLINTPTLQSHHPIGHLNFVDDVFSTHPGYNPFEYRWGDGAAKITDFYLLSENTIYATTINTGKQINIEVAIKFYETLQNPIFGVTIKTKEGIAIYGTNTEILNIEKLKANFIFGEVAAIKIDFICRFAPGDYFISLGLATRQGEEITPHDRRYDSIHFQVRPTPTFFGLVNTDLNISIEEAKS